MAGQGLEDVEHVFDFWDIVDEVDVSVAGAGGWITWYAALSHAHAVLPNRCQAYVESDKLLTSHRPPK